MGEFFSQDLYDLIMGKVSAESFRKVWGEDVAYDVMNAIINVGENTIIIGD